MLRLLYVFVRQLLVIYSYHVSVLFSMCVEQKVFAQLRQVDVCYLTGLAQRAGSTCTATHEKNLKCKFAKNIYELHKDFSLFFYPDRGAEGNCLVNDEVNRFGITTNA